MLQIDISIMQCKTCTVTCLEYELQYDKYNKYVNMSHGSGMAFPVFLLHL